MKDLQKYKERYTVEKKEPQRTNISKEKNEELFDLLIEKYGSDDAPSVYERCPGLKNIKKHMIENRDTFEAMPVLDQAEILLQVLTGLKCNSRCANFKKLCGLENVGRVVRSKKLEKQGKEKLVSAYLINQSVTGLYEKKVDLLK